MKVTEETTNADLDAAALQEQIRRRAYELYEQRGRLDGHEHEDWLQAEAELSQIITKPLSSKPVKANRTPRRPSSRSAKAKQI